MCQTRPVGLRTLRSRLSKPIQELNNERLQDRYADIDVTPIGEMQPRVRCRVGGEVSRMRLTPRSGGPALQIGIDDGTGRANAIFTGRRSIPGIEFGRHLILEGVAHVHDGELVLLNPAYTLL